MFVFSRRDGAGVFFSEVGRGGCFSFPRRDGAGGGFSEAGRGGFFFFRRDGTGRCFFFFRGPGRNGCFWRWQFFWRDGAKSLHRPAKGGLNRPASRRCKALVILERMSEVRNGEQKEQKYLYSEIFYGGQKVHKYFTR